MQRAAATDAHSTHRRLGRRVGSGWCRPRPAPSTQLAAFPGSWRPLWQQESIFQPATAIPPADSILGLQVSAEGRDLALAWPRPSRRQKMMLNADEGRSRTAFAGRDSGLIGCNHSRRHVRRGVERNAACGSLWRPPREGLASPIADNVNVLVLCWCWFRCNGPTQQQRRVPAFPPCLSNTTVFLPAEGISSAG